MSNLVPEKRVDKNGVVTTKHVRSEPKTGVAKPLPAPALAPSSKAALKPKKLTKTQTEQRWRSFQGGQYPADAKLLRSLQLSPAPQFYSFRVSDEQLYNVLSVVTDNNAIAFLHAGITTPEEVMEHLQARGLSDLAQHRDCALEALSRRIPPETFIRSGNHIQDMDVQHNPFFMDSLEVAGMASLDGSYAWDVLKGTIRIADIKTVGATRIKNAQCFPLVGRVLRQIAAGEVTYTAEDVKDALHYYRPLEVQIERALTITDHYGSGFIKRLNGQNAHVFDLFPALKDVTDDRQRGEEIFLYAASVVRYGQRYDADNRDVTELVRFFDAGISPEEVATGAVTINQLDAIEEHGISPSVSGGWL